MDEFLKKLLAAAKKAGIEAAEIYLAENDSFRAMAQQGQINNYTVNTTRGLSLRGLYKGKMGYASSEAMDDEAIEQLVKGVIEAAELIEDEAVQEIYKGDADYPKVDNYNEALNDVSEKEKLDFALTVEKETLAIDPRIVALPYNMITTTASHVTIQNSYGLNLKMRDNMAVAVVSALAKEGEKVASSTAFRVGRDFSAFNTASLAQEAASKALFMLKAEPVKSGVYRAIFDPYAMSDMLSVFSSIFSSDNTQQGLSLLDGKEGEKIAADCVTIMDDPLLPGGLDSRGFDDEGVKSQTKAVVENGVLKTLLYNLKTARKAGKKTTGNARKYGYSSSVRVAPSNLFFAPGKKSQAEMMQDMKNGLVITEVSGLHAGADSTSGDFSLIAEGFTVQDGKKDKPVEQITVAGNFYALLKNIRALGNDLFFPGSPIGSPSVDVGEIKIAGK